MNSYEVKPYDQIAITSLVSNLRHKTSSHILKLETTILTFTIKLLNPNTQTNVRKHRRKKQERQKMVLWFLKIQKPMVSIDKY